MKSIFTYKSHAHPELDRYVQREEVRTAQHNKTTTRTGRKRDAAGFNYYKHGLRHMVGGLTTFLKSSFYRHVKVSKRKTSGCIKQASSKRLGNRVDRELVDYCKTGKVKKNAHQLTHVIVRYMAAHGYVPVAAQLPVVIQATLSKTIMTQADLIVRDAEGRLHMLEVKTGAVAVSTTKGTFAAPYQHVSYSKKNAWDMQRHFTHKGLVDAGLPLASSKVVHAYQEKHGNVLSGHVKEYGDAGNHW